MPRQEVQYLNTLFAGKGNSRPRAANQWLHVIKAVALEGRIETIRSHLHENLTKPISVANSEVD